MSAARRSGRAQVPNKKYSDGLANEINDLLGSDSEINGDAGSEDSADEFNEQDAVAAAQDEDDINDEASDLEAGRSSAGEGAADADADYENDLVEFETPVARPKKKPKREALTIEELGNLPAFDPRATKASRYEPLHTRGVVELEHHDSRHRQVTTSFGPGTEDVAAYIRTKSKWYDQLCFPTAIPHLKTGVGGLAYSFFYPEAKRAKERKAGWQWYYENGGRESFRKNQKSIDLAFKESYSFRPPQTSRCNLVYGSTKQPKYLSVAPGQSIPLRSAFDAPIKGRKSGYVLNVGGRVQCLEWIPNQPGGSQYLCAVTQRSSYQNEKGYLGATDKTRGTKAFTPSPQYRTCMEIWVLDAKTDDDLQDPHCRAIFSWDWGDLRCMQWCPVPIGPDSDYNSDHIRLGLLAGIWTDGYIRVLDLSIGRENDSTQHTHIIHAAFENRPPDTLCTHLCWLSSRNLAASCANGFVCVWDLATILTSPQPTTITTQDASESSSNSTSPPNSRPWFYHPLHTSYIYTLTSGYPSRPHMLFTTSIDGHTRVTDLRHPTADTATTSRTRVTLPPILWSDHTQSLISTDENFALKLNPLRRFYSGTSFARTEGLVTCLAGGVGQPGVLAGCADGRVWSGNPARRSGGRSRGDGGGAWRGCWFEHTWRRGVSTPAASGRPDGGADGDAMGVDDDGSAGGTQEEKERDERLREPLVRIVDGFKIERANTGNASMEKGKKKAVLGGNTITIHEEKTAVTKVAWNPNLRFGTWAAAGMVSGLVRIENLAVDAE